MATTGPTTANPFVASPMGDLSLMDIDTAMMAVQTHRAELIETQLKDQMSVIQSRNQDIELLNAALSEIRRQRPNETDKDVYLNTNGGVFAMPNDKLANGMEAFKNTNDTTTNINATGVLACYGIATDSTLKQGDIDQLIQRVTAKIDTLNSSQQMDMLRLQSLTNKRNEAYDVMSNFLKKSQDGRSNIVSNMR
jgi:hypothetical protein